MMTISILVGIALIYNFINGFSDSSTIVATIISSRSMSPRLALVMVAIAEFLGPFIFGVAVAHTIGKGIVDPQVISAKAILAALLSAIFWMLAAFSLGIPCSSSHALIGGLTGAALASAGVQSIQLHGIIKVLIALFLSPVLGLGFGFLIMRLVYFFAQNASMRINWFFKRAQIFTVLALALSYGANDAQKTIGVITLILVVMGFLPSFTVAPWVIVISGVALGLGTMIGGWRLIRTLGGKFYKIRPVHGFSSQFAATSVILGAALLGGPVSTTQVVSSTILGVGAAERLAKVRWNAAGNIVTAWFLTIPTTFLLSVGIYWVITRFP